MATTKREMAGLQNNIEFLIDGLAALLEEDCYAAIVLAA